jgi:hypothetical protein
LQRLLCGLTTLLLIVGCAQPESSETVRAKPAQQVVTGSIPPQSGSISSQFETLNLPGLSVAAVTDDDVKLLLVKLTADRFEPRLIARPDTGASASQIFDTEPVDVIIGSGFVSQLHSLQPVGLLQVAGRELNALQRHGYTRILGIINGRLGVVHKQDFERGLFHDALQVGPGIVEDGKLDISERDLERPKYFRSFVALCDTYWLLGVSVEPVHLRSLGQAFLKYAALHQLQCDEVVNLAGDRQALLAVRNGQGMVFHGDPATHKVSLLAFRAL